MGSATKPLCHHVPKRGRGSFFLPTATFTSFPTQQSIFVGRKYHKIHSEGRNKATKAANNKNPISLRKDSFNLTARSICCSRQHQQQLLSISGVRQGISRAVSPPGCHERDLHCCARSTSHSGSASPQWEMTMVCTSILKYELQT